MIADCGLRIADLSAPLDSRPGSATRCLNRCDDGRQQLARFNMQLRQPRGLKKFECHNYFHPVRCLIAFFLDNA